MKLRTVALMVALAVGLAALVVAALVVIFYATVRLGGWLAEKSARRAVSSVTREAPAVRAAGMMPGVRAGTAPAPTRHPRATHARCRRV